MEHEKQFEYYVATRPPLLSDYSRRSPEQMAHDLNVAHDFIRKLVREKDQMREDFNERLRRQRTWVRILTTGLLTAWGALGWIVQALLKHGGLQ